MHKLTINEDLFKHNVERKGYFMVKKAISQDQVNALIKALNEFDTAINHHGIRDLMNRLPCIREMALSVPLLSLAKDIAGDKAKVDMPGFSSWREKQC